MSFSPTSPVTGQACTGLTTPTFTLTAGTAPDATSKAYVVSALGGTQTGVTAHSNELPNWLYARRPKAIKTPGAKLSATGQYTKGGKNEFSLVYYKGCNVLNGFSNVQYDIQIARMSTSTPAAVGNDAVNLASFLSMWFGLLGQATMAQGWYDLVRTSVL